MKLLIGLFALIPLCSFAGENVEHAPRHNSDVPFGSAQDCPEYYGLYHHNVSVELLEEEQDNLKQDITSDIDVYGLASEQVARRKVRLAALQEEQGLLELARDNYQASVDTLGEQGDQFRIELIEPLNGLGRIDVQNDQAVRAVGNLERALLIENINFGPRNFNQVFILELLSSAYVGIGKPEQAQDIEHLITDLYRQKNESLGEELMCRTIDEMVASRHSGHDMFTSKAKHIIPIS